MANDAKHPVFTRHSRSWRDYRYVYPVISRRSRGLSIGINLNPDAACNFDCVYCSVDRRTPRHVPPVDLDILGQELDEMLSDAASGLLFRSAPFQDVPQGLRRLNDVAFSGDGEPTTSPAFSSACRLAAGQLQIHGLRDVKLVLITNATMFDRPPVTEALELMDRCNGEIWAKLDAGTEEYYKLIERTNFPLEHVLRNILAAGRIRPLVIQSMFLRFHDQPPSNDEIEAYRKRLEDLLREGCRIKAVHLYTIARTAAESYATALSDKELDAIATRLETLNVHIEKFYCPG